MRIDGRHHRGASRRETARGNRHVEPECTEGGTHSRSSRCKALLLNACLQCRDAKRRCDHLSPCTRCKRMGLPCTVPVRPPGRPRKRASGEDPTCASSDDATVSHTSSSSSDLDVAVVVVDKADVMAKDVCAKAAAAKTAARVRAAAGGGGGDVDVGGRRWVRGAGRRGKRSWGNDGGRGEEGGDDHDGGAGGGGAGGASHVHVPAVKVPTQVVSKLRPSKRARGMTAVPPLHTDHDQHDVNAHSAFTARTRTHTHTNNTRVCAPALGGVEGEGEGEGGGMVDVVSYTTACMVNSVFKLGSTGMLDGEKARGFLRRMSACFNHGMGKEIYIALRDVLLHVLGPELLAHDSDTHTHTHTHTHTSPSVAVDAVADAGAGEGACRMQWTIDARHRAVHVTADTRMCSTFLDAHDTLAYLTQTGLPPMYTCARVLTGESVAVVCDAMCAVELGFGGDQGCDGVVVECNTLSGHTISCVATLSHHCAGPHTSTTTITLLPYPAPAPVEPPIIADILEDIVADNARRNNNTTTTTITSSSSSSSSSSNHNLPMSVAGGPVGAAAAYIVPPTPTQRVGGQTGWGGRGGGGGLSRSSAPVPVRAHAHAHGNSLPPPQQQHTHTHAHAHNCMRTNECTPLVVGVDGGVAMPVATSTSPATGSLLHGQRQNRAQGFRPQRSTAPRSVSVSSPPRHLHSYYHHQQQPPMVAANMQSYAAPLSFAHTHSATRSHPHPHQQEDGEVVVTPRTPSTDVGVCQGGYDGVRVPHTHTYTHTHMHAEAEGVWGEEGPDVALMDDSLLQLIALELTSVSEEVGMAQQTCVVGTHDGCGVNVNSISSSSSSIGSSDDTASLAASACAALPHTDEARSSSTHTHHPFPLLPPPPALSLTSSSSSFTTIASTRASSADESWPSSPLTHSDAGSLDFDLWLTGDEWGDTHTHAHTDTHTPAEDTPACVWDTRDPMDPLNTMPISMSTLSAQSSESDASLETVCVFDVGGFGGDVGGCGGGASSSVGAWGTTTTTFMNKHTAQMPSASPPVAAGTLLPASSILSPSSSSSWAAAAMMTSTTTTTAQQQQQVQLPPMMQLPSLHTGLSLLSMGSDTYSGGMLLDDWAFHTLASVMDGE